MTYVHESLSPGEKIFKVTHYHWIYIMGSVFGALIFIFIGIAALFLGIIYHYYDIVKVPPWMIHKAAAELAFRDYLNAFAHTNILFRVGGFMMFLMAFIQVGARMLVRATTEMAITNRRAVFKRGLVARKVEEMRIDYIEGADVNQTLFGRLLDYGQVKVYGTGSESIIFPVFTADPVNFKRALEAARNTLHPPQPRIQPDYIPELNPALAPQAPNQHLGQDPVNAPNPTAPRFT